MPRVRQNHRGLLSDAFLQVDIDLTGTESLNLLTIDPDENGVQMLRGHQLVFEIWPEQPARNKIHIFVKLPATGMKIPVVSAY